MDMTDGLELIELFKDQIDCYNRLYKLDTFDDDEIASIYKDIKNKLIETKRFLPYEMLVIIENASLFNNCYIKSYWSIYKKIFEDYNIKPSVRIKSVFDYMVYKEFGIPLDNYNNKIAYQRYESDDFTLDVHEENTIYRAIMQDDIKTFISIIERSDFNKDMKLYNIFYPQTTNGYSLLELCSYHGAVNCFKFLRTEFDSEITKMCLDFSFLRGQKDILSMCLEQQDPDEECLKYAIISHNIDFVTYLMDEYQIDEMNLSDCLDYNNIQAFFYYYDRTQLINTCFVYVPYFKNLCVCEYFILQEVDVNKKDDRQITALHWASLSNNVEILDLLISHGADLEAKDKSGHTPLLLAT